MRKEIKLQGCQGSFSLFNRRKLTQHRNVKWDYWDSSKVIYCECYLHIEAARGNRNGHKYTVETLKNLQLIVNLAVHKSFNTLGTAGSWQTYRRVSVNPCSSNTPLQCDAQLTKIREMHWIPSFCVQARFETRYCKELFTWTPWIHALYSRDSL